MGEFILVICGLGILGIDGRAGWLIEAMRLGIGQILPDTGLGMRVDRIDHIYPTITTISKKIISFIIHLLNQIVNLGFVAAGIFLRQRVILT